MTSSKRDAVAWFLWAALTAMCAAQNRVPRKPCDYASYGNETIYDFVVENIAGTRNISLSDYRGKEPGGNGTEIMNGIKYVRPGNGFVPNFPLFKKDDVNGEKEQPLFAYLKKYCPSTRTVFSSKNSLYYDRFNVNDIRWNFEKFLISRQGIPLMRYDPTFNPVDMVGDVEELIAHDPHTSIVCTCASAVGSHVGEMHAILVIDG